MNEFNPYEAPISHLSGPLPPGVTQSGPITSEELRAFVGPRADYYLGRWWGLLQDRVASTGFNWPAFIFTGLWLPYRKMYRTALFLYGFIIAESVVENLIFQGLLHKEGPTGFGNLIGLGIAIFCGSQANTWYYHHARRVVEKARALGLTDPEYRAELARRGGTSLLASLGLFACFVFLVFAAAVIEEMIVGGA